jgi:hypothetical protein
MVAIALISSLFLAASAVAIPTRKERLAARLAKGRTHGQRPEPYSGNITFGPTGETAQTNIMQDNIWAGPSYTYPAVCFASCLNTGCD